MLAAALAGAAGGVWLARHGLHAGVPSRWPELVSLVPYLVLSVYWSLHAKQRHDDRIAESAASSAWHKILVNVAFALIVLPVPALTARLLPPSLALVVAGLAVEFAGLWLAIAARRALGRNWSAEVRIAQEHALVETGPYRRLRHPIYTGALCMYVGLSLVSGELHALVGLALVIAAYLRKVRLEERLLAANFGSAFEAYRKRSWALLPLLY